MSTLTTIQRQQLREVLEQRKEALLVELDAVQRAHLQQAAEPEDRIVDDPQEQAERLTGEVLTDAEARRDHDELVQVRAALARMDDGSYGSCITCYKLIATQRLLWPLPFCGTSSPRFTPRPICKMAHWVLV